MIRACNWGVRLLSLVLCLACLVGFVLPVAAVEQTAQPQFTYTSLVHYSAYASSDVIGQLEDGAVLEVLGEYRDFYKIDCDGMTGYIAKGQVQLRADGKYYVNCDKASQETSAMACVALTQLLQVRAAILELAQEQLGDPYVYGGMAPGGFDCSGLTTYVYAENGYDLNRCASDQLRDGIIVAKESLQVGDLIFFREAGTPWLASHVGIYVGDNTIIHAKRGGIRYSTMDTDWYIDNYIGARRIVNVGASTMECAVTAAQSAASYTTGTGMRTASSMNN